MTVLAAIGALIPISVAAAISTVPLLAMIALLLSDRKRGAALAYLIGWVVGLFAVAGLFSLGLSAAAPADPVTVPVFGGVETVVGAALVVFGVTLLVRRAAPVPATSWTDRLSGMGPLAAAGLGVVLNLRPKALLLAAAAGIAISVSQPTISEGVVLLAVYTALGCSSVAIPVILTLARPGVMEPRLRSSRDWLARNQRIVTGIVIVMVGAVIAGNGLTHLGG